MDREELLGFVARGDTKTALEHLYAAHHAEIARFVRTRLGSRGNVDDVCQEVWAAVARGLASWSGDAPVRAWVFGIARFKTIDVWRADGGLETLDSQLGEGGALASMFGVREAVTPTRELSRQRKSAAIRAALETLRADDRELIELRFVHGLKPAEIAKVLEGEIEPNTVSQRVLRASKRLRVALVEAGLTGT